MAGHNGMSRIIEDTTAVVVPTLKEGEMFADIEVKSKPVCEGMATGHLKVIAQEAHHHTRINGVMLRSTVMKQHDWHPVFTRLLLAICPVSQLC